MTHGTTTVDVRNSRRDFDLGQRLGTTRWDAVAALLLVFLVVAYFPPFVFSGWVERIAILLVAGPVGLVVVAQGVRGRDNSCRLLAAALVWTVLVAALSDAPRSALLGFAGRDLSALTVVLSCGLWGIGRKVSPRGSWLLGVCFVGSVTFVALVGFAQVLLQVQRGPLAMLGGRPTGVLTNPVYFGALVAAGLVCAVASAANRRTLYWLVPILLTGAATSLSGSRVALLAALAGLCGLAMVHRTVQVGLLVGASVASLVIGVALDRLVGVGSNAADRLASSGGGGRTVAWQYALDAAQERPIAGYGFGLFRPAVQGRFSVDFVSKYARDETTQAWFDPHNIVLTLLVSVGFVGFGLFAAWAITWSRQMRGPLVWLLVPLLVHWCLQPLSLYTMPAALLIAGAGRSKTTDLPGSDAVPVPRTFALSLATAGGLIATALFAGSLLLRVAGDRADGDLAASASTVFLGDAVVADYVAQIYGLNSAAGSSESEREINWRETAAAAEPDRPYWWTRLALEQLSAGDLAGAEFSIAKAESLQPHNIRTLRTEGELSIVVGDTARLQSVLTRLCAFGTPECDMDAQELIRLSQSQNS